MIVVYLRKGWHGLCFHLHPRVFGHYSRKTDRWSRADIGEFISGIALGTSPRG